LGLWSGGHREAHAGDLRVPLGVAQLGVAGQGPMRLMLFMVRSPYSRHPGGPGALTQPKTGAKTPGRREPPQPPERVRGPGLRVVGPVAPTRCLRLAQLCGVRSVGV
jgi:hypothetical protein